MDSAVANDGVEDFHIFIMLVILLQFVWWKYHFPPGFVNLICKPPFAKASMDKGRSLKKSDTQPRNTLRRSWHPIPRFKKSILTPWTPVPPPNVPFFGGFITFPAISHDWCVARSQFFYKWAELCLQCILDTQNINFGCVENFLEPSEVNFPFKKRSF